tara:strand:+ start:260194 stop:261330 length:1137 start_codon:yes stop_codon:yes gene_type:complete
MKMKRQLKWAFSSLFILMPFIMHGHQEDNFELSNEGYYISEFVVHTNVDGKIDADYLGWFFNTTSLKFHQKHSFNLSLLFTHGGQPTSRSVGDLQYFTNIEVGLLYGLNEMYYKYESDVAWFKIGQQDINMDFMFTENGLLFNHSSFGIDPGTTLNLPAPTAPYVSLSLTGKVTMANIDFKIGVFDGQYAEERGSLLPVSWRLKKSEGLIYIIEPEFTWLKKQVTTKIGALYHSGNFQNKNSGNTEKGLLSFHSISDFNFYQHDDRSYHLFYQINSSHKEVSDIDFYLGLGLRMEQPFKWAYQHELGFAMGHAHINSEKPITDMSFNVKSETALETTFKVSVSNWFAVQPYFQYIVFNEKETDLKEPKILGLRAHLNF